MTETITSIKPVPQTPLSRNRHYIRTPDQLPTELYVPQPDAELFVQSFLMMHRSDHRNDAPRTALLQSGPGSGKSLLCLRAALMLGTAVARIPPSVLSSRFEGGAVETLTDILHACEQYSRDTGQYTAVLFEDVDTGALTISENTGHTVNTLDTIGHLQFLADNKHIHVNFDKTTIPFIATANAASEVRASLFRDMRAETYTHVMPEPVKELIAQQIFAPVSPEEQRIVAKLFKAHRTEQPAFWKQLAYDYRRRRIQEVITRYGSDVKAVNAELAIRRPLDGPLLHELAKSRRAARPITFLFNRKR